MGEILKALGMFVVARVSILFLCLRAYLLHYVLTVGMLFKVIGNIGAS